MDGAAAPELAAAWSRLRDGLTDLDRVVVAFSGGADSALVAFAANDVLGPDRCHVVTAVSPSLPATHRQDCVDLASRWNLRFSEVHTEEMENAAYRVNDANRCFHCKDALMDSLGPVAEQENATVLLGVNVDDLGDHRPGQVAAAERGARFPLVEAGFTKDLVRAVSRDQGLSTWDKPAAACLASRLPYGTKVTLGRLSRVERAEASLTAMGFTELRVRDYGESARIEVPIEQLINAAQRHQEVAAAVKSAGFVYATLDLEGLRSGNLNQALSPEVTGGVNGSSQLHE